MAIVLSSNRLIIKVRRDSMDEKFVMFLNDIPASLQGFVLELDAFLISKGCKREIKVAKSGFVSSYIDLSTKKTLLNYVFRKTGVKMRIYAAKVANYDSILDDFPTKMKKEIIKAGDCKKLTGATCSPTCPAGYTFVMDGTENKKCRSTAFFHDLNEESSKYIWNLIESEVSA